MENTLIAALASGVTMMFGVVGLGIKNWFKARLRKLDGRKFSEQLIYHKYVKTQLDELSTKFGAKACLAAKFHNGQYYTDGKHILKWSVVLVDSAGETYRDTLQNRLTSDSPVFFGDLKEKNFVFSKVDQLSCDGMRRLLSSLNIESFIAVLSGDNFVFLIFEDEEITINKDKAELIRQDVSTFAEFI